MTKLKDIVSIKKGTKIQPSEMNEGAIRFIQIDDLRNNDNIKFCHEIKNYTLVNENDIIIAWDGANAGTIGYGLGGAIGSTLARLRITDNNIYPEYLGALLQGKFDYLRNTCTGATIPHISRIALENLDIPMLPIEEQKKIASILYKICNLIIMRKKQIYKLELLIRSRFAEMFGDPVLNSKKWDCKSLDEYILFITSGSRGWSSFFCNEGKMFLTIKNVKNNKITTDNIQYINVPDSQEAKRTKVQENDLLISITADLGRTGIVTKEIADYGAYINQHLSLVRVDTSKICPLYISYYLESEGGIRQFQSKNQSAVKAGLNFNAIKSLQLLIPPIEYQYKFAKFVQQVDKQKLELQSSLSKMESSYRALMLRYFG